MTDESGLKDALERHVPLRREVHPDWQAVIALAGAAEETAAADRPSVKLGLARRLPTIVRRHRLATAVAVTLIALATPVFAVGASRGWWFLNDHAPVPADKPNVVATGEWDGHPWTLTAYRSDSDGLCIAMTVGEDRNRAGAGAAMNCSAVGSISSPKNPSTRALTYLIGHPFDFPDYIVGAVVADAARVAVALSNGQTLYIAPSQAPHDLGADVNFYAKDLPCGVRVWRVAALDNSGAVIGTFTPLERYRGQTGKPC